MKAEKINKYIDSFIEIYDENGEEINPIPEDHKVTVYCESDKIKGFVENSFKDKLGFEALITKKWILHSHLKQLSRCQPRKKY